MSGISRVALAAASAKKSLDNAHRLIEATLIHSFDKALIAKVYSDRTNGDHVVKTGQAHDKLTGEYRLRYYFWGMSPKMADESATRSVRIEIAHF